MTISSGNDSCCYKYITSVFVLITFGVCSLETHEKQPRKKVENLLRLPDPPAGVTMTKEELAAGTGLDGNPLRFSVNGKVCEVGNCPDALKQGMLLASGREVSTAVPHSPNVYVKV